MSTGTQVREVEKVYLRSAVASRLVLPSILGAMSEVLVAPAGISPAACPKCEHYQSENLFEQTVGFKFRCRRCNEVSSIADFHVDLAAGQERFLDDKLVRGISWWHASLQPDWLANVTSFRNSIGSRPMVHVGQKVAAMDRLRDIGRRPEPKYLYEVKLRADAEIAPGLFQDHDRWPRMSTEMAGRSRYPGFSRHGATRYVNHYEAPGAISLIVNCAALELVRRNMVAENH